MNTNNTAIHHASLHRRAFLRRSSTALGVTCLGHTLPAGAAEAHPWLRSRQQVTPLAARPVPCDIQHIVLHRDPAEYSGHPRQTVFAYFGGGEMVVGHNGAPCRYESAADVQHDFAGYHSRAKIIVQRTLDGGKTWPADQEVAVYDETITPEQKEVFLHPQNPVRQEIDMFHPESVLCVGHTFPNPQERKHVCFALRSPDKGRTWEKVPTILPPPPGTSLIRAYGCPVVRMPDGRTLLMPVSEQSTGGGVWIYASTDHGLHWQPLAPVALDKSNTGRFTYPSLLLLPDGQLHSSYLHVSADRDFGNIDGIKNAICVSTSKDGGRTWSEPLPIVGKGGECWKEFRDNGVRDWIYRSPWSILLRDGRILVIFARRYSPMGIGGTLSTDGGRTWSEEFVLRANDASNGDLGYPVGCQLDDGGVFIAYYYNDPGKTYLEAVRYIAGTSFRLR